MDKMDNFTEFIKKYGKPYDPETDDYNIGPFQKSFDNASKSSKIYNMHMYWTKQDPYVVKEFIEHHTKPGDIVLDAFCGTGMTGVAAMMCGRHAMLCDISSACIHIAKNYTTPIDPSEMESAFKMLRPKIEAEIKPLYVTKCHICGNTKAEILNIVLSDVYRCPRCKGYVLFTGGGRWESMKSGKRVDFLFCEHCSFHFKKTQAKFLWVEPVEIRIRCQQCKPKRETSIRPLTVEDWEQYIRFEGSPREFLPVEGEEWRFISADGNRYTQKKGNIALENLKKQVGSATLLPQEPHYWYPKEVRLFGHLLKRANAGRHRDMGLEFSHQLYSRRNLIALSVTWHYINQIDDWKLRDKMRFAFTVPLFLCSFLAQWSPGRLYTTGAIRKGTLYIPSIICENSVLPLFANKVKNIMKGMIQYYRISNTAKTALTQLSATNLTGIPNNTVDYLFYDPPYGANIMYSELNIVWEAWLESFTKLDHEIIENSFQDKDRKIYGEMMFAALKEGHRVLKPNRWLTMVYSYSDASMYRVIQSVAYEAGFGVSGYILHVTPDNKSFVQRGSDKAQQRFLVINFKKQKHGETKEIPKAEDIEYEVIKVIQEFLTKHPGKTRDYIYDQAIKRLFSSVQIQKFNIDEVLRNFFRKIGDEWYAPGTLVTRKDEKGQLKIFRQVKYEHPEKEIILNLQEFLKIYGMVPYSELREYYLRKIDIPLGRDFDELIRENFVVEEGKVRLPTPQEQARMQDVTIRYKTRLIKRFLEGGLDKIPDDREVCEWVEFCYQNGLYSEGARLFSMIREDMVSEDIYAKAKKIAEVCRIKAK